MPKRKITRDKEALAKTLRYLSVERQGQPTSVSKASDDLGVKPAVVGQRMHKLSQKGQVVKLGRGFYSAGPPMRTSQIALADLLEHLKKEREQLDAKIVRVQETLEIHQEWIDKKQ